LRVLGVVSTAAERTRAPDDEQERSVRLLLLGKGAVLDAGSTIRSLLRWTIRSSGARGRQLRNRAIAMRLAVFIRVVGDIRRGGEGPDRAAS
jgi:hypothetical protein